MKNMIKKKHSFDALKVSTKTALICLSCLAFTAGCANSGMSNFTGVEAQNRNIVEMVRVPYNMNFNANETSLSETEIVKLNHFLRTSNITYGDEFSMDFPLENDGSLSDIDSKRLMYISTLLKDSGLHMSEVITPYGMEPKNNSGRLLVSKYIVTPPECGDWRQPADPNYDNAPLSNLGCASQANLGLMVANPRDLITGQDGGKPNAERTARAVERYQSATVTVATETSTGGESN